MVLVQGLLIAGLVLIHCGIGRLRFLGGTPRSVWLSGAGGVSVAYVFVHLLPELGRTGHAGATGLPFLDRLESHDYLIALTGLVVFYGLERMVRTSQRRRGTSPGDDGDSTTSPSVFWLHIASFALYNLLIGYLLVDREDQSARGLAFYFIAMALHFVVTDFGLRHDHRSDYAHRGRWLLSVALVAGWLLALVTTVSPRVTADLFAFLAGGNILNILKEELPAERESRFLPFALGTFGYALLLLAT